MLNLRETPFVFLRYHRNLDKLTKNAYKMLICLVITRQRSRFGFYMEKSNQVELTKSKILFDFDIWW